MSHLSDAHKEIYRELIQSKEQQNAQAERIRQLEQENQEIHQANNQLRQRIDELRISEGTLREETNRLNQLITRQNLQSQMIEEGFTRMKQKADRAADWERMFNERNQVVKDLEYYLNEAQDKSKKNAERSEEKNQVISNLEYQIKSERNKVLQLENSSKLRIRELEKAIKGMEEQIVELNQSIIRLKGENTKHISPVIIPVENQNIERGRKISLPDYQPIGKVRESKQILLDKQLQKQPQKQVPKTLQRGNLVVDLRSQIINLTQAQLFILLKEVHHFKNLQSIWLSNNKITDKGLNSLAVNGDKYMNLQQIDLSKNQISDHGLKVFILHAWKFRNPQSVWLDNNQITDDGLKILAQNGGTFQSLKQIDLSNNQITRIEFERVMTNYHFNFTIEC